MEVAMGESSLDRRRFLRCAVAGGAAAMLGSSLFANRTDAASRALTAPRSRYQQPNIVFIVLDETRFPTVFPAGINDAGEFLAAFMPNLHLLWENGVKFRHHYSAGVACSPGRAAFATGLYPHQTWMLQTRKGGGSLGPPAPSLKREFPTYGKLLRNAGYDTPYVGKWHLSDSPSDPSSPQAAMYLHEYGFQGLTVPDIVGANGDGAAYDGQVAATAMQWLEQRTNGQPPFCLTVSFVNSHDREYFWGGIEAERFNLLYDQAQVSPMVQYEPVPSEIDPQPQGYPTLPPNWESMETLHANKPSTQVFARSFTELVWGGITDDPRKVGPDDFELREYPLGDPKIQTAYAPYTYWQKGLDSYTQIMNMVDGHIGSVLASIPGDVAENTVFVMTSDHGDFSGAHGFPANKAGTAYEEAFNVPLIVADPTGRFTGDTDVVREQLTSSVDLAPMFATLGTGSRSWMRGDLARIYARRLDLTRLLRSNRARGRDALVMSTDEVVPSYYNFNGSPRYILALRTEEAKLAVYADWRDGTAVIDPDTVELEFYDYATEGGRLELDNQPDHPQARRMLRELFTRYVPQEMEQPLPGGLGTVSSLAKEQFIAFVTALDALGERELTDRNLGRFTAYGDPF
jgi:arylsulfatase A-like enzyme